MNRPDPHSYFDITQPRTSHIHLDWFVDFERRLLDGAATLELEHPSSGPMDLDTKGLSIHSIHAQEGSEIPYELAPEEPVLGSRLRLNLPDGTKSVVISYTTSPEAIALQWLEPQMTLGKRHPFMYSQCQAIHARTVMPCQDTPRVRISYKAAVEVPEQLTAVMSAGPAGLNPGRRHSTRLHFSRCRSLSLPIWLRLRLGTCNRAICLPGKSVVGTGIDRQGSIRICRGR